MILLVGWDKKKQLKKVEVSDILLRDLDTIVQLYGLDECYIERK